MSSIIRTILSFGPAFLAIGYTIGTGSVTAMIVAGSAFGMQLLWVLLLSCLFSGVLIYAYGNFTLVTGETALYSFKKHLRFGKPMAILIIVGVSFGQWNSLVGILGISANIIFEMIAMYFPSVIPHKYGVVIAIAVAVIGTMYSILLIGKYSLFEKILVIFVSCMGISFILSLFVVHPLPVEVIQGLIPVIPDVAGGKMMVAAFVGTTMAAATFLSRPLFIQGKGWTEKDYDTQKKDSIIAAVLIFLISGSIMAVASGSLHGSGVEITHVLDMSQALEPSVGRFAVSVFFIGTLSAGLSSIFPCLIIVPLMLGDFNKGQLDVTSSRFKLITAVGSILALSVPVFGINPIKGQIFTQFVNVFALPLVVMSILFLWNRKNAGLPQKRLLTNIIMIGAFIFSLIIMTNGLIDIFGQDT